MKNKVFRILLKISLFTSILELSSAQEWTQFRGPGTSGHSPEKGIPETIQKNNIKWSIELPGSGHSSPVLWGDTVFLTVTDKESSGLRYIIAFSSKNGKEKWRNKQPYQVYKQHRFNNFSSSTPCCDAKRIYVTWTSPDGVEALALDHNGKDGKRN